MKFLNKVIYLFACFFILTQGLKAQDILVKSVEDSDYPQLKLRIYDRNPTAWEDNALLFKENGTAITNYELSNQKLPAASSQVVLILFENSFWMSYNSQRDYFKQLLQNTLPNAFGEETVLYLAEFDWTDASGNVLSKDAIVKGNAIDISNAVAKIEPPASQSRVHQFSEVNTALMEGLEYLDGISVDSNTAKSILILSGEVSNIYNSQHSQVDIIYSSRQKDIPVYAVRYPRMASKYSLERIAEESFGDHLQAKVDDINGTGTQLSQMLSTIAQRASGNLYELSYETKVAYGGEDIELEFLNQQTKRKGSYDFSSPSLVKGFFSNTLNIVLVIGGFLLLIGLIVFFVIRSKKKAKAIRAAERQATEDRLAEERAANEQKLKEQEERFLGEQLSAEEKRMEQEFLRQKATFEKASEGRLKALARQPYIASLSGQSSPINKTVLKLGRSADTDIQVDHKTVSRTHAYILFEKTEVDGIPQESNQFYLLDAGSANGTFVNGKQIRSATVLKDGDVIKLGDATISFRW